MCSVLAREGVPPGEAAALGSWNTPDTFGSTQWRDQCVAGQRVGSQAVAALCRSGSSNPQGAE